MQILRAVLVMLDISGYTRFVKFHSTSLLHAEEIITELLEAVIDKAEYPLTIAKLEGDAVFLYAESPAGEEAAAATDVSTQIDGMFTAFYAREQALVECRHGCVCEACQNIQQLKLKAFLHTGEIAIKQIRQFTEVAGQDVILIHRLLKNSIPAREYILFTAPFHALAGDYAGHTPERRAETVTDFDPLDVLVYYPNIAVQPEDIPAVRGTELAARLNRYSFARMLLRRPRSEFNHLPATRVNLIEYLIDGIASGVNVLRQQFTRG